MCPRVIDLHCHILPGIDDGAGDVEDAAAMAAQAQADGIETICATPHIRHDHDVRIPELPARVETLNGELDRRGISTRVVTGGEVAESALDGLDSGELARVALAGGRWVLLEPAPGPLSGSLVAAAERLSARGYRVLVAHPERHPGPDSIEILTALVGRGALVQGTAAFLEGGEDAPLMGLARRGLVHVLGSDSHSARIGRPVRVSAGLAALTRLPEIAPHADWVTDMAPAAILAGEDLTPPFQPS